MTTKPKTETETSTTGLPLLRVPFPAHQINQLPKGGVMLDFVGHAALTDRLLDADPSWNWEPLAMSEHGLPLRDDEGGLWIRLTVCGVTRLGYGHAGSKQGGDAIKELIGDALRNGAMRFGAALGLWHKGDLHISDAPEDTGPPPAPSGYEDWLLELARSATTTAALQKQWKKSALPLRKHLTATDSQWWTDLKATAAAAEAPSA
jgi:hypothetical protein